MTNRQGRRRRHKRHKRASNRRKAEERSVRLLIEWFVDPIRFVYRYGNP